MNDSTVTTPVLIKGDAKPKGPKGYRFKYSLSDNDVCWSPQSIHLFQPARATNPLIRTMNGAQFLEYAIAGEHLVNANALNYVVEHPEHYFEAWKGLVDGKFRIVFFCGSIFIDECGTLCVAGLQWDPEMERLERVCRSVLVDFGINCFAVSTRPH